MNFRNKQSSTTKSGRNWIDQLLAWNWISNKKKELVPILLKLFQKTEEEGTLPNSFNDITIIITPEQDKGTLI